MAGSVSVEVRLLDLPQLQALLGDIKIIIEDTLAAVPQPEQDRLRDRLAQVMIRARRRQRFIDRIPLNGE